MKINLFKKILAISTLSLLMAQVFYISFEPSTVVAATATDNVIVTLDVTSGITITAPADVTMAPNIGISADSSIGSATWNVKTNHATGYTLSVKASASPALVSGVNSFADYTPAVADTPEVWSVASGAREFGYSVFGTDTAAAADWGSGNSCGSAGSPTGTAKYLNFKTTDKTVATRALVTLPTGVDTTICFSAQQNNIYAPSGTYTATITATATEI